MSTKSRHICFDISLTVTDNTALAASLLCPLYIIFRTTDRKRSYQLNILDYTNIDLLYICYIFQSIIIKNIKLCSDILNVTSYILYRSTVI